MTISIPLQWTTALLGLGIACTILLLIRKDSLHVRHSIWWLVVAGGSVLLGFFPRLVDALGIFLGVHYPPVLFLTLALGMVLIKILTMDIERSRQERALRRLTQRFALLEQELHDGSGKAAITPKTSDDPAEQSNPNSQSQS